METQIEKFKLGDLLEDKITGFSGVVMVVARYATGCVHMGLQPRKLKEDGTTHSWEWLDQSQLELVTENAVKFNVDQNFPSGPSPKGPQL